jgi:hypothetical protein
MPARDDDQAMEGLLRRSLARDAAKAGECPDADILAAYYERSLDADEAAGYEQHIAQCSLCREHLAAFVRAESELEVPAEQVLVAARPAALQPKAASRAIDSAAEKPKHSWVFGLRWLAPAAAVIVFAVFVYVRMNPREAKSILSKNQVAAVKQEPAPVVTPLQDVDAVAPAARSGAPQESHAKPPAASKGNAPSLEEKFAAPPAAPVSAPATHPPPTARPAPPPRTTAGANDTHASSGISSRFAGGAMARSATAAGTAATKTAQRQETPAAPAAPPPAKTADAGQRAVSGTAGGAAAGVAAPAPAPARVQAKKEAAAADSTAQSAEANAANDKTDSRAVAGRLTEENINSVTQSVTVTAAASTVEASQVATLFRVTPDGAVERSTDSGTTWRLERLKTHAPIVALSAPSGNICWVVGRGGTMLLTKNGKSWKKISPPERIDLVGVTAQDAESAVVTAVDGRKFTTGDGGKTWELLK